MTRVLVLASEPVRPAMGGLGIRAVELGRTLARRGFDVALASPSTVEEAASVGLGGARPWRFEPGRLVELAADRDVLVAQGQLANDAVLGADGRPVVVDLFDPWLVENFRYLESLGLDPYRNDHASWVLQMTRGDRFLVASPEQRLFYAGFLAAVGRVHPRRAAEDPGLDDLLLEVPFGCAAPAAAPQPLLGPSEPGERRIFFGGIYDWYDVDVALAALALGEPTWTLWVVRHPDPAATPQAAFARLEAEARRLGLWGERVRAIDWAPADRRHDLLASMNVLAAPHRPSLESDLAFRTRYLEALAAGLPVVATRGGTIPRLLVEREAGWVVEPGDAAGLARALAEATRGGPEVEARIGRGRELAAEYAWDRVVEPLARYLEAPRADPSKGEFGMPLETVAPRDGLGFRLRRRWRRLRGAGGPT